MQGSDYIKFKMMDSMDSNNKPVTSQCSRLCDKAGSSPRQNKSLDWVLVYFPTEDAVCHPLPLQEVETLMGDTGVQAGLKEGDTCLASFFVGDALHTAQILRCSESKAEILLDYERVLDIRKSCRGNFLPELGKEMEKENTETGSETSSHNSFWHYAKYMGSGVAIGGLTVVAAPLVMSAGGAALTLAIASKALPLAMAGVGGVAVGEMIANPEHKKGQFAAPQDENPAQDPVITPAAKGSKCSNHAAKDIKRSTPKSHHSLFSSTGLGSAVQGVFSWFSGTPDKCSKEEEEDITTGEGQKEKEETLIDLSEEPTCITAPSIPLTGTGRTSVSFNHLQDPDDLVQGWLKQENHRLWEERKCKICADGETAVLFDPCGHMCACLHCSVVQRLCPMCGQFIQNHHRVFRS